MKVLLVGYGSIAKKHISVLRALVPDVEIFALRSSLEPSNEEAIINLTEVPSDIDFKFIMVCNPTYLHTKTMQDLIYLNRPFFLEKPPFQMLGNNEFQLMKDIAEHRLYVYCAFNLRFLETLQYLKKSIDIDTVQEVNIYCGSFLPEWRSNNNYKESYSAKAAMGGGVHLDLIHEIDYAVWLFGVPNIISSTKKSKSHIHIDAIDYAHYTFEYDNFVLNITLNYFRREPKRSIEILTKTNTIYADLMINNIEDLTAKKTIFSSDKKIIDTYTDQMRYFLDSLHNEVVDGGSLENSLLTLKIALA